MKRIAFVMIMEILYLITVGLLAGRIYDLENAVQNYKSEVRMLEKKVDDYRKYSETILENINKKVW